MASYRLKSGRSVRDALRRVAGKQLDEMVAQLRGGSRQRDAVHEARKCSKRLRSLLRLVREPLGERTFARENKALRDAMRALSPVRDAEALLESLAKLAKHRAGRLPPRALQHLRDELRAQLANAVHATRLETAMRRATRVAKRVRSRVSRWPIRDHGWAVLEPGVRAIYAKARAAARDLGDEPDMAQLHEWRKRAKNLQHLLELLEEVWPPVMRSLAAQGDALSDRLGDDRDLARLEALAQAEPTAFGTAADRAALLARIKARRRKLLADARAIGEHLLAEKAGAFAQRLGSYWHTWRRTAS